MSGYCLVVDVPFVVYITKTFVGHTLWGVEDVHLCLSCEVSRGKVRYHWCCLSKINTMIDLLSI